MESKLLRNWTEIASVACEATRYALSACTNAVVLAQLAIGFPQCFRKGKSGETDKFSWKRILRVTKRCQTRGGSNLFGQAPYMWLEYFRQAQEESWLGPEDIDLFSIPVFAKWGTQWFGDVDEGRDLTLPPDILSQLSKCMKKEIEGPLFLEYEGARCVVGCIWSDAGDSTLSEGAIFTDGKKKQFLQDIRELALVPADVIAFDC